MDEKRFYEIVEEVEEMVRNSEFQIYREELEEYIKDTYYVDEEIASEIAWMVI